MPEPAIAPETTTRRQSVLPERKPSRSTWAFLPGTLAVASWRSFVLLGKPSQERAFARANACCCGLRGWFAGLAGQPGGEAAEAVSDRRAERGRDRQDRERHECGGEQPDRRTIAVRCGWRVAASLVPPPSPAAAPASPACRAPRAASARRRSLLDLPHCSAQGCVGGAQRRGHRSDLNPEQVSDRPVVEVGVVAKEQRCALPVGQCRNPRAQARARPGCARWLRRSSGSSSGVRSRSRRSRAASLTTIRQSHASSGPVPRNEERLRTAIANADCTASRPRSISPTIPLRHGRSARSGSDRAPPTARPMHLVSTPGYESPGVSICLVGYRLTRIPRFASSWPAAS